MYQTIVSPPVFYDDTELSASALKVIRNNIAALDAMARRGNLALFTTRDFNVTPALNPHRIWWGSFQFRTTMSNATIVVFCTPTGGGENLRVTFNGVQVYNAAMTSGFNTVSINISNMYFDKTIVLVDVMASFSGSPSGNAVYMVTEAYVSPANNLLSTAWVAPATFGSITRSNLNTLVDAQRYLIDRMKMIPIPLQMSLRYVGGRNDPGTWPIGTYRFARTGDKTKLRVILDYWSRQNQSTTMLVQINGTTVDSFTFGQWQKNTYSADLDISGYAADTSHRLQFVEQVNTGPVTWRGAINTKYATRLIETVNTAYTGISLPTETQMLESMTFSTLQSRLNALGTAMTNIKSTIDANTWIYNRIPMFARRLAVVDDHDAYNQKIYLARKKREGNVIVVRGRNLSIGWGYAVEENIDEQKYTFSKTESLTGSEQTETKVYYLDQFDGIYPGFPYFIMGEYVEYAAEHYSYVNVV